MRRVLRNLFHAAVVVLLASAIVHGQGSTAQISGTVRDQSGGVLTEVATPSASRAI